MIKHLLAGAVAAALMSGAAFAQTYPPAPTPVAPPAPIAGSSTSTTTTVAPGPNGGYRASTTRKGVDINGNQVTAKHSYKEGISGSTETRTRSETDPGAGTTTTRSKTTTSPQ
jgi:opacity protein-like surface antigen